MKLSNRLTSDFLHVARGLLMGGADVIPGVSGGTVALILGIYNRLVTAISRFDMTLLKCVMRMQWSAAAQHVDLRFLIALGCGIALGVGGLASLMLHLLEHQRQPTFAVFFGLILASCVLVARMVKRWTPTSAAWLVAGAAIAYTLVGLPLLKNPPSGNGYVFLCGTIAICAMILPGISGAFILLILGKYGDMMGVPRDLLHGMLHFEVRFATIVTFVAFAMGCVIGLLSFSKVLRWLLARHESTTMAVLCGFMAGSLRKIWPFKIDLTPALDFRQKQFQNVVPDQLDGQVLLAIALAIIAAVFVFTLDWVTRRHEHVPSLADDEANG